MQLEINKTYKDRNGTKWKVIEIKETGKFPVTVARWHGTSYRTRTYLGDGHFFSDQCGNDPFDLIEEVPDEPAREGR